MASERDERLDRLAAFLGEWRLEAARLPAHPSRRRQRLVWQLVEPATRPYRFEDERGSVKSPLALC